MKTFDVAVIGAGPAGSAAAIALAQRGYEVALIDKKFFPREKLCGDFVNPINWPVFRELGVENQVLARPHAEVSGFRITTAAGREATAEFTPSDHERPAGLGLRRAHLDQVLIERALELGVTVRQGQRIEDLSRTAQGWRLANKSESMAAKVLVGADGRNSWVAQRLDLNRAGPINGRAIGFQTRLRISGSPTPVDDPDYQTCALSRFRQNARVRLNGRNVSREPASSSRRRDGDRSLLLGMGPSAAAAHGNITDNRVEIHLFPGGYAGVVGLGDGTINLCLAIDKRGLPRESAGEFLFSNILQRNPFLKDVLLRGEAISQLRSVYPVYFPLRRCYDHGVLLAGDAARVSEPVTGEGIYFAMRSGLMAAETLDLALERGDVSAAALQSYRQNCRRAFRPRMALNSFLRFAIYRPVLLDAFIRLSARHDRMLNSLVDAVCAPRGGS